LNTLEFTTIVGAGSLAAGCLGALTGLGGGVVIVPMLVLIFHVDLNYAIGASLVSVIATSSGAAASYVKEGYSNIRIGMFLEIATTIGALVGASLVTSALVPKEAIAVIFGLVLLISAFLSSQHRPEQATGERPNPLATRLRLDGTYPTSQGLQAYHVYHVPVGFGLMFLAGTLSGLLGIGSGALKVLAMDQAMRIPFKVSTTTSNFMIGVTAAASAGIYLRQGYITPTLSMPVMLGVLLGSLIGARLLVILDTKILRRVFGLVILALAVQMIYKGLSGGRL
jgi:uncharacterized membrane protein YfcA